MNADSIKQQFQQAAALFQGQQYEQALQVLEQLDGAVPNNQDILYFKARVLGVLNRPQESAAICDRLSAMGDLRGEQLKAALTAAPAGPPPVPPGQTTATGGPPPILPGDDMVSSYTPPPQFAKGGRNKKLTNLAGFGLMGALLLSALVVVLVRGGGREGRSSAQPSTPMEAQASLASEQDPGLTGAMHADSRSGGDVGGWGTIETVGTGDDAVTLVKIGGNRYEMGYWYGKLLADQIAGCWAGMRSVFPASDAEFEFAINAMWNSEFFDTDAWEQEFRGVADGCAAAGHPEITFHELQKLHMLPDMSEHGCGLFAVWGEATVNGDLYQLRNLDWSTNTGAQDYPVVAIFDPEDGERHAVIGFAGLIGAAIGGMNEHGIAQSQIMGGFGDSETLKGVPFPILLRDVLYHDRTLAQALSRIQNATRTNEYHYCISGLDPLGNFDARLLFTSNARFDAFQGGAPVLPHPHYKPFYEPIPDAVYWKRHDGGAYAMPGAENERKGNQTLHDAITSRYGAIGAREAIEIAMADGVASTVVSIVYNATAGKFWVAYALGATTPAHERPYVEFNLETGGFAVAEAAEPSTTEPTDAGMEAILKMDAEDLARFIKEQAEMAVVMFEQQATTPQEMQLVTMMRQELEHTDYAEAANALKDMMAQMNPEELAEFAAVAMPGLAPAGDVSSSTAPEATETRAADRDKPAADVVKEMETTTAALDVPEKSPEPVPDPEPERAEPVAQESEPAEEPVRPVFGREVARVLEFPNGKSLGHVSVRRKTAPEREPWERAGEARGKIGIPPNQDVRVQLRTSELEALARLAPDDIQVLSLWNLPVRDGDIEPIKHLTGLRELDIRQTRISPDGWGELREALPNCRILY